MLEDIEVSPEGATSIVVVVVVYMVVVVIVGVVLSSLDVGEVPDQTDHTGSEEFTGNEVVLLGSGDVTQGDSMEDVSIVDTVPSDSEDKLTVVVTHVVLLTQVVSWSSSEVGVKTTVLVSLACFSCKWRSVRMPLRCAAASTERTHAPSVETKRKEVHILLELVTVPVRYVINR